MAAFLGYVCFSMAWCTTFIVWVPSMSWSVLPAARVTAALVACLLYFL
jgi:hypothetical protein